MIFKIIENTNIHVTNIMQFQTISKTLEWLLVFQNCSKNILTFRKF
jgi:rRNA maturation endonuclease Nob1